jgi:hypothetical protein
LPSEDCAVADSLRFLSFARDWHGTETSKMGVLAFIALTVAVFAVLGLVQKLVERL